MSYWNHRVVKEILLDGTDWYSIRECHYNDNGTIFAYTEEPIDIAGESIENLRDCVQRILRSLDKPILIDGEVKWDVDK